MKTTQCLFKVMIISPTVTKESTWPDTSARYGVTATADGFVSLSPGKETDTVDVTLGLLTERPHELKWTQSLISPERTQSIF